MSEQRSPLQVKGQVVTAVGFGTAVGMILAWALREFGGVEMPAEIAVAGGNVVTFIVQRVISWLG